MKNELVEILKNFIVGKCPAFNSVNDLEWRLEKAKSNTLVVYYLRDGRAAEESLKKRLSMNRPALLILSRPTDIPLGVPSVIVRDGRWNQVVLSCCDLFYPLSDKLKFAAVTGTNGKTTTVDLVLQICELSGLRGISIGTLGVRSKGKTLEEFGLTTPGLIEWRKIIYQNVGDLDFVVMEASSHALDQGRLGSLKLDGAAWTSFSQDHLDYHKTMDEYFKCKLKIVDSLKSCAKLYVASSQKELISKLNNNKSLSVANKIEKKIQNELPAFFRAKFNLDNLECARELALSLGVEENKIEWKKLLPPPGRFHVTEWQNRMAIVDFAHTPDALDNICKAIKESFPGRKLVVLFGCGGDRDRTKRPLMAQAVAQSADKIILTSDNPRGENPDQIIKDIEEGILSFKNVVKVTERPLAIRDALKHLNENEILLVAGKGHEEYIQIGKIKIPHSDQGEIDKYLKGISHG